MRFYEHASDHINLLPFHHHIYEAKINLALINIIFSQEGGTTKKFRSVSSLFNPYNEADLGGKR